MGQNIKEMEVDNIHREAYEEEPNTIDSHIFIICMYVLPMKTRMYVLANGGLTHTLYLHTHTYIISLTHTMRCK